MAAKKLETRPNPRYAPSADKPWTSYITLDLVMLILRRSIFHPFIACLIPLCLRAQAKPYHAPSMIYTMAWAMLVTVYQVLASFNHRLAYGAAREVDLEEEVVLITGGSGGLGGLIAEVYGMRGVSVAVLDVHKPQGEEIECVEFYECDISSVEEVSRVKALVEKELGPPTIIINCAALRIHGQTFSDLSSDAFLRTMNVNLLGSRNILKAFLPGMLNAEAGGTFVTVSSVLSHFCPANLSDYAASKAALSAMHTSLTMELRRDGNKHVRGLLVETGQLGTSLFGGVETPSKFLAPVLETREVAKEIMSRIDAGEGGVLRMPEFAGWVSWYGVLPASIQVLVRRLSRIDVVMANSNVSLGPSAKKESDSGSEGDGVVVDIES